MKPQLIAMVAHEVNRAYCESLGDATQLPWDDAPEWQKQSALNGVAMHLANPNATPEQSHQSWLDQKLSDGWKWGEKKDPAAKLHPCIKPYDELPAEQKAKDYLFRGVVHAMAKIPEPQASAAAPDVPRVAAAIDGKLPVKYVGKRESYVDGNFGTKIHFVRGQTVMVEAGKARLMFGHPDVYVPGNAEEADAGAEAAKKAQQLEQEAEENAVLDAKQSLAHMTKDALVAFARTNFNQALDKALKVDEMRTTVSGFIDRFGLAK